MANGLPTAFVMHGARDAISRGLAHIEQQVTSIELAVIDNPGLAFDLAKTLVESVCKTVLVERGIAFTDDDDLPKLFRTVSQSVPFLPPTAASEASVRKSLAQTLGGLNAAIHGICELRNQCGFASHGSGEPRPAMETAQAILAAEAADTIVGFLHRIHRQDAAPPVPPLQYEDNAGFNAFVDESHTVVHIFDEVFVPSRVLFELAPEPYRVYVAGFNSGEGNSEDPDDGEETPEIAL
jgi:hypothetical protein